MVCGQHFTRARAARAGDRRARKARRAGADVRGRCFLVGDRRRVRSRPAERSEPNGDLSAVRSGEHGPAAELPAAAIRAWILSQHRAAPRLWPPRSESAAQPAVAATGANLLPRLVEPILSRSYD